MTAAEQQWHLQRAGSLGDFSENFQRLGKPELGENMRGNMMGAQSAARSASGGSHSRPEMSRGLVSSGGGTWGGGALGRASGGERFVGRKEISDDEMSADFLAASVSELGLRRETGPAMSAAIGEGRMGGSHAGVAVKVRCLRVYIRLCRLTYKPRRCFAVQF